MAKHSVALDNLVSADVVTADGSVLTANASENSGLFLERTRLLVYFG